MAEFEKDKAGLQKKVSSVFKGVPVPRDGAGQRAPGTPAPDQAPGAASKPASAGPPTPQSPLMRKLHEAGQSPANAVPDRAAGVQAPPMSAERPTPQRPAAKNLYEPQNPPEEAAPAKQPKVAPLAEAARPSLWQQINNRLFPPKPGVNPVRQKAMVILVPVLAIVMIFVFRQVLSKAPRQTQGATEEAAPLVAAASSNNDIDWQIPEPLPATMRDPIKVSDQSSPNDTQPSATPTEEKTHAIDVRDIVYSEDKPSAFMNGRIVHVGDKIGDTTIIQINRNNVEFERDGKRWVQNIRD
jgi:hypothetical protein